MSAVPTTDFLPDVGTTLRTLVPMTNQAQAVPVFVTQSARQSIVVYYPPAGISVATRKALMGGLTLCGRCSDTRPTSWQTLVLSWSILCFPELLTQFQNDTSAVDYIYEEYPVKFAEDILQAVREQGDPATVGDKFVAMPGGLPNAALIPINVDLAEACNIEALYAYYAMLVYIMGKALSTDNITAISTKRPDALIRKRQLQNYKYILQGGGQVHPDNYKNIQSGWVRSTCHRVTVVNHLAKLNASTNRSELLDSICVNMDMLKNSGQSYVFYIHELLVACPWTAAMPGLRPSYYHYVKMVTALTNMPPYIQPYYKMMMQDSAKDVRRKDIEPLIAVATFFAAQTRPSMSQYRIAKGSLPVIQAFRVEAAKHGMTFADVQNQMTTESTAV